MSCGVGRRCSLAPRLLQPLTYLSMWKCVIYLNKKAPRTWPHVILVCFLPNTTQSATNTVGTQQRTSEWYYWFYTIFKVNTAQNFHKGSVTPSLGRISHSKKFGSVIKSNLKVTWGVPVVAQWKWTWLVSMRIQVLPLASLWHCRELWYRLQTQLRSCVAVAVV